ncbi:MAG: hypothetical protein ACI9P5_004911, partial [Saprospiraceae bacterium]
DPTNELQDISIVGHDLSLSNGSTLTLPDDVDDADADPTNELQTLTQTGTEVILSDGGGMISVADNDNDSTNELQDWNSLPGIPAGFSDGIDNVDDADGDPTNELQDISIVGHDLSLSNGSTLTLPDDVDDADADPTNELQDISIVGHDLSLSNGSTLTLPDDVNDADNDPMNELNNTLVLNGTSLEITDAGGTISADLSSLAGGAGADDQQLSFTSPNLTIEDGNTVDLSALQRNAENGLNINAGNETIRLGGTLIQETTITQGAFDMNYNLNGTGDFHVADNGANRFSVLDNGRTTVGGINNQGQFNVTGNSYFSDDIHLREGAVDGGDMLVRIYDLADDGVIDIYENNAYNIRLHGNGASIFNEQGIASNDFRVESSTQANMFFIDAGTDEIGIRTNAPTSMLQMTNGGVNVGANAMASFDNAGADGVSISGDNSGTTNGYNGVEGVVAYSGTAFNATGVFGLAIDNTLTNSAVGVRGTINGRDGFGVLGTRANGAGSGWAGLFIEDLGYTGFFGAASDESLKKNIEPIQKALDIVDQLNPVTYDFDLDKHPGMGLNTEMEYGFIAQEVQKILPEIVREKTFRPMLMQKLRRIKYKT